MKHIRNNFGCILFPVLLFSLTWAVRSAAVDCPPVEFFEGRYEAVGRKPDSGDLYTESVTVKVKEGNLIMTRCADGETRIWTGRFETASPDRMTVLRFRSSPDGTPMEITYTWNVDPDNRPRLTGYVYRKDGKTRIPGMDTLFSKHGKTRGTP
ncbi:hypothetical protein JXA40_02275 [bacterium]|nr:hypothetical protein [candidate division CSSED10-310 bacterium]